MCFVPELSRRQMTNLAQKRSKYMKLSDLWNIHTSSDMFDNSNYSETAGVHKTAIMFLQVLKGEALSAEVYWSRHLGSWLQALSQNESPTVTAEYFIN